MMGTWWSCSKIQQVKLPIQGCQLPDYLYSYASTECYNAYRGLLASKGTVIQHIRYRGGKRSWYEVTVQAATWL